MKTLNGYEVVDEKARERLDTLVIPTKTSQLENDSQFTNKQYVDTAIETAKPDLTGYYTQAQTDAAIQTAIGNIDIPTVPTNVSAFTNDAQYTNKTYVDNAVASVDVSAQLTEYAKKTELPTKVSQLENDAGYLTEHQSLSGYATETYVDNKVAEIDVTTYATKQEVTAVENKIPSLDGYATEQYVNDKVAEIDLTTYATKQELTAVENKIPSLTGYATEAYVDGKIAEIPGTDLSNYYNKEQTNSAISTAIAGITIPTKVSELENDSNFVTETALETKGYLTAIPEEYVTETELDNKGYLTAVPAEYVTDTELNNKGYLTAVPDTYALKTDIPDVSSFTTMAAVEAKGYALQTSVDTKLDAYSGSEPYEYVSTSKRDSTRNFVRLESYNYTVEQMGNINTIALRDSTGQLRVPATPSQSYHAASKSYVDTKVAEATGADLSNYYTKAQTDSAISTAVSAINVPTKVSDLTNDSGYQTASQVNNLIDEKIGSGGSTTQKDWIWNNTNMIYSDIKHARFVLKKGVAPDYLATVDISGDAGGDIVNSSYAMYYHIPDVFGILKTENYSTYSSLAILIENQQCYIYAMGDGQTPISDTDMSIVGYYYWGVSN